MHKKFSIVVVVIVLVVGAAVGVYAVLKGAAPQPKKIYRVGILDGFDFFEQIIDGYKAKMTQLGYVEGGTIVYNTTKAPVDIKAYDDASKKFVTEGDDVILSFPTEAIYRSRSSADKDNFRHP